MKLDAEIQLLKSVFKGREDIFALRWEKANKSMSAYSYVPYMYRLHKQRGGTFKDYKDKTYLKLLFRFQNNWRLFIFYKNIYKTTILNSLLPRILQC